MNLDLHGLEGRLTKKLGPLPVWVWALIIVGVGYAAYHYTVGKSGGASAAVSTDAAAASDTAGGGTAGVPVGGSGTGGGGSGYVPPTDPGTTYVPPMQFGDSSYGIGSSSFGAGGAVPAARRACYRCHPDKRASAERIRSGRHNTAGTEWEPEHMEWQRMGSGIPGCGAGLYRAARCGSRADCRAGSLAGSGVCSAVESVTRC